MTDQEIECLYIYLSRGGHLKSIEKDPKRKSILSTSNLKEKVKGFDSQDLTLIFPDTLTLSSSDHRKEYSEEITSEKYTEIDKDEPVGQSMKESEIVEEEVINENSRTGKHSSIKDKS